MPAATEVVDTTEEAAKGRGDPMLWEGQPVGLDKGQTAHNQPTLTEAPKWVSFWEVVGQCQEYGQDPYHQSFGVIGQYQPRNGEVDYD